MHRRRTRYATDRRASRSACTCTCELYVGCDDDWAKHGSAHRAERRAGIARSALAYRCAGRRNRQLTVFVSVARRRSRQARPRSRAARSVDCERRYLRRWNDDRVPLALGCAVARRCALFRRGCNRHVSRRDGPTQSRTDAARFRPHSHDRGTRSTHPARTPARADRAVSHHFFEPENYPILPAHVLAATPLLAASALDHAPIGTGPYRLARWKRGDVLELHANPTYFGGAPHIARLDVHFIASAQTIVQQLRTSELDAAFAVDPSYAEQLRANPKLRIVTAPIYGIESLTFQTTDAALRDAVSSPGRIARIRTRHRCEPFERPCRRDFLARRRASGRGRPCDRSVRPAVTLRAGNRTRTARKRPLSARLARDPYRRRSGDGLAARMRSAAPDGIQRLALLQS